MEIRNSTIASTGSFGSYVRWARWAALTCIGLIIVLSTVSGNLRPHTGAPGNFEHAIAYAATGAVVAFGFSSRPLTLVAAFFAILSGSLEIAQIWIPGRSAGWDNFVASTAGALAGGVVVRLMFRVVTRRIARPQPS